MTALWKPKPSGLADEGFYLATIVETKYVGDKRTQYGVKKDWQDFVIRVEHPDGSPRDIHWGCPLTINEGANFGKLLVALEISLRQVERDGIDPDSLVGMQFHARVFHKGMGNAKHANVVPLPPRPVTLEQIKDAENQLRKVIDESQDNLHPDYEYLRKKLYLLKKRYEFEQQQEAI